MELRNALQCSQEPVTIVWATWIQPITLGSILYELDPWSQFSLEANSPSAGQEIPRMLLILQVQHRYCTLSWTIWIQSASQTLYKLCVTSFPAHGGHANFWFRDLSNKMDDSSLLGRKDCHMVRDEKISNGQSSIVLLQAVCLSVCLLLEASSGFP
jgi:hypothetical protein